MLKLIIKSITIKFALFAILLFTNNMFSMNTNSSLFIKNRNLKLYITYCAQNNLKSQLIAVLELEHDINCCDIFGRSALIWACKNDNLEIAELLINKGALLDIKDIYNKSALDYAKENSNLYIISLINYITELLGKNNNNSDNLDDSKNMPINTTQETGNAEPSIDNNLDNNLSKDKNNECKICNKRFSTCARLHIHKRYVHSTTKAYKCNKCDKSYKSPQALYKHKEIHKDIQWRYCNYLGCQYRSKHISNLMAHKQKHLSYNSYICNFPGCTYSTKWQNSLKRHKNKQHSS